MKVVAVLFFCCVTIGIEAHNRHRRLASRSEFAKQGEFPYLVSLQMKGSHICGGSLITRTHVLTAAHCVSDYVLFSMKDPFIFLQLQIEVGSTRIGAGKSHQIQRIAYRKNFSSVNVDSPSTTAIIENDIAVITLKSPVILSQFIGTINLPTQDTLVPIGAAVTVAGFGSATRGGSVSNYLKKTVLNVISDVDCDDHYYSKWQKTAPNHLLCAKRGPGYGTCGGDSGGPMIFKNTIVGIVSGGDGDCGDGLPAFFTEVSQFLSFIRRAVQGRGSGSSDTEELDADDMKPKYQLPHPSGKFPITGL